MRDLVSRSGIALLVTVVVLMLAGAAGAAITEGELRLRVEAGCRDFKDLTMTGTVVYKNRDALARLDPTYARLYDFKSATVAMKAPDKLRMDGKLGMVKFEYIINGPVKIMRAPIARINKREDYTGDPAKLQSALDVGIVTPAMWRDRKVTVLDDVEAQAAGEIKLQLRWAKGDMIYLAWLDAATLALKRYEKRDAAGNLLARAVYSAHQKVGDVVWMPLKVEVFTGDGQKAGASEFSAVKVNTGLPDTLFQ